MCSQGLGIVQLHQYVVHEKLLKKELIEVLNKFIKPTIPIYIYYEASHYTLPKFQKFIEFFSNKVSMSSNKS